MALVSGCRALQRARLATDLVGAVDNLYGNRPTDDVTAMVIRIPYAQSVALMYGPPEYKEDDAFMVGEFMEAEGYKIVCGGTTSNIVAGCSTVRWRPCRRQPQDRSAAHLFYGGCGSGYRRRADSYTGRGYYGAVFYWGCDGG